MGNNNKTMCGNHEWLNRRNYLYTYQCKRERQCCHWLTGNWENPSERPGQLTLYTTTEQFHSTGQWLTWAQHPTITHSAKHSTTKICSFVVVLRHNVSAIVSPFLRLLSVKTASLMSPIIKSLYSCFQAQCWSTLLCENAIKVSAFWREFNRSSNKSERQVEKKKKKHPANCLTSSILRVTGSVGGIIGNVVSI